MTSIASFSPRLEEQPSSGRFGKITCTWRAKEYTLIFDRKTDVVWGDDSASLLRFKFFLLVPGTLLATLARIVYHLGMCLIGKGSKEHFFDIFRAPFYGVAATFVALYGIFDPLSARPVYHGLERALFRHDKPVRRDYLAPCFTPWSLNKNERVYEIEEIFKKRLSLKKAFLERCSCNTICPQLIRIDDFQLA